jgi:hypothetical protein
MNTDTKMREIGEILERAFVNDLRIEARTSPSRRRMRLTILALAGAGAGAAAAVVLATGAVGSSHASRNIGNGGSSAPQIAAAPVAHGQDTAYIVRRVSAHLATVQSDVGETVETGGNGNPGTDVTATSWGYTDPQSGVQYESSAMVSPSGTNVYDQFMVGTPIDHGARWQSTNLDPVEHLYAVTSSVGSPGPTVADDIQQIKKELDSGQATRDGTAIVDGQPTVKLTMPTQEGGWTVTLYVNSRTYAPVQSFAEAPTNAHNPSAGTGTTTEKWLPATTANIANARLAQIPPGYTQVSQTALEKANPAGR